MLHGTRVFGGSSWRQQESSQQARPQPRGRSPRYRWYALGVLMLLGLFNYLDRRASPSCRSHSSTISLSAHAARSTDRPRLRATVLDAGASPSLASQTAAAVRWLHQCGPRDLDADDGRVRTGVGMITLTLLPDGVALGEAGWRAGNPLAALRLFPRASAHSPGVVAALIPLGPMLGFLAGGWLTS